MQDYRNLKVWKLAIVLARETYRATSRFPSDERFKLRAQIRSAASSVPANIAEGRARGRDREFAYFLRIALGSATELESHLFLARNLGFIAPKPTVLWPRRSRSSNECSGCSLRQSELLAPISTLELTAYGLRHQRSPHSPLSHPPPSSRLSTQQSCCRTGHSPGSGSPE